MRCVFWERLEDFKKYQKNGRVSRFFVTPEGVSLGVWLHYIDSDYESLSEEKKEALEKAGYRRPDKREGRRVPFAVYYAEFVEHKVDGSLPKSFISPAGNKTGMWVQRVRMGQYQLSPEERRLLEEAGFRWHVPSGRKKKK